MRKQSTPGSKGTDSLNSTQVSLFNLRLALGDGNWNVIYGVKKSALCCLQMSYTMSFES